MIPVVERKDGLTVSLKEVYTTGSVPAKLIVLSGPAPFRVPGRRTGMYAEVPLNYVPSGFALPPLNSVVACADGESCGMRGGALSPSVRVTVAQEVPLKACRPVIGMLAICRGGASRTIGQLVRIAALVHEVLCTNS